MQSQDYVKQDFGVRLSQQLLIQTYAQKVNTALLEVQLKLHVLLQTIKTSKDKQLANPVLLDTNAQTQPGLSVDLILLTPQSQTLTSTALLAKETGSTAQQARLHRLLALIKLQTVSHVLVGTIVQMEQTLLRSFNVQQVFIAILVKVWRQEVELVLLDTTAQQELIVLNLVPQESIAQQLISQLLREIVVLDTIVSTPQHPQLPQLLLKELSAQLATTANLVLEPPLHVLLELTTLLQAKIKQLTALIVTLETDATKRD